MEPAILDKMYFKIGEVSCITGLEKHVLRFWETEFKDIKPRRTSTGQRMYRKSDIEMLLNIKRLLYNEKFTIQGAKNYLNLKNIEEVKQKKAQISFEQICSELEEISRLLEK